MLRPKDTPLERRARTGELLVSFGGPVHQWRRLSNSYLSTAATWLSRQRWLAHLLAFSAGLPGQLGRAITASARTLAPRRRQTASASAASSACRLTLRAPRKRAAVPGDSAVGHRSENPESNTRSDGVCVSTRRVVLSDYGAVGGASSAPSSAVLRQPFCCFAARRRGLSTRFRESASLESDDHHCCV
jgi:hypothetical protein